ncbi:glycerate kinase [Cohnella lupini]|uniref:Glycerate kinase n=1 Tax=Cohnella lupini TaxID=1294267 RepID=A0A3D9IVI2_9BACL|nr:glycerate kinase [Cohnella lupini]RED65539.1 glycerate kinase [Cohnella lupini]
MKFVVAPDSFKESLSASEAARIIGEAIRSVHPNATVELAPMADGGEGTVEALVAAGAGKFRYSEVTGPLGKPVRSLFGILDGDDAKSGKGTAVLEAASIFGLTIIPLSERNPYRTTTRGMGELMLQLLDEGFRKFIVGLGGSGTNDGGMGLLSALGAVFLDKQGESLRGFGEDLLKLDRIGLEALDPRLSDSEIVIASDVQSPLCGPDGASRVYGLQKGASPDQIDALDLSMSRYADRIEDHIGLKLRNSPGAGAAGGAGFALLAMGAKAVQGAEVVADASRLGSKLSGADWVITGEGKSDNQTLNGKLPFYVARLAKETGARTILISGSLGQNTEELEKEFSACFACVPRPMTVSECLEQAETTLSDCVRNVVKLLSVPR